MITHIVSENILNYIRSNIYYFSKYKCDIDDNTFCTSLIDNKNQIQSFNSFFSAVKKVYDVDRLTLEKEYLLITTAAQMFDMWQQFAESGDRYNLQLRAGGNSKYLPLHDITLPFNSSFWREFYPPNGWHDDCVVVQVRKTKYPLSDEGEAIRKAKEIVNPTFRFHVAFDKIPASLE